RLGCFADVAVRAVAGDELAVKLGDGLRLLRVLSLVETANGQLEPLAHLRNFDIGIAEIVWAVDFLQRVLPVGERLGRLLVAQGEPQFAEPQSCRLPFRAAAFFFALPRGYVAGKAFFPRSNRVPKSSSDAFAAAT